MGGLGVDIVHCPEMAAVVLDTAQRGTAQLAGGVDAVDGLVLGQAALVAELLATGLAGEYVLKGFRDTTDRTQQLPV